MTELKDCATAATDEKDEAALKNVKARQCIYGSILEIYFHLQLLAAQIGELSYDCPLPHFLTTNASIHKDTVKKWEEKYNHLLSASSRETSIETSTAKMTSIEKIAEQFNQLILRYCEITQREPYKIDTQMIIDGIPLYNLKQLISKYGLKHYDVYTTIRMDKKKFEELMDKERFLNENDIRKFEAAFSLESGSLWAVPPFTLQFRSHTSYFIPPSTDKNGTQPFFQGDCLRIKAIRENYRLITNLLSKNLHFTLIYNGRSIRTIPHQSSEQVLGGAENYRLTLEEAEEITKSPCQELEIKELSEMERQVIYKLDKLKPCTLIRSGDNFYIVDSAGRVVDFGPDIRKSGK